MRRPTITRYASSPRLRARTLSHGVPHADLGGVPLPMTPSDFGKLIAEETEKWGKVIRAAGIKPD